MVSRLSGVRIAGIASAAPTNVISAEETGERFGTTKREATKIAKLTGVLQRRVAPAGLCTSDMAFASCEQLLKDLNWDRSSVDSLILVTQTADFRLPATACVLQHRLGLSEECAAFDVPLGCSGYVYGLWLGASLISSGAVRRVILLAGDTSTWFCDPQDRSTAFLFGDAATATAMEASSDAAPMDFVLGTSGAGKDALIHSGGGCREMVAPQPVETDSDEAGKLRNPSYLFMDGAEVFQFTQERVPAMMERLLQRAGWTVEDVDAFVPHQANQFILQTLFEQMGVPSEKLILSLEEFGNTSSASIPISCTYALADRLRESSMRLVLAGFGVGWSWGAAAVTCGPMVMSDLILLGEQLPVAEYA